MPSKATALGRFVLDLLFPRRCPWCGRVVGFTTSCCTDALQKVARPRQPVPWVGAGTAAPCLTSAWACYEYESPVKDAIIRMKYEDEPGLAQTLGAALCSLFDDTGLAGRVDAIVPVPVSAGTLRRRGYNQAQLMAEKLAAHSGLPLQPGALQKHRETEQQMTLDRAARLKNPVGAYLPGEMDALAGKRILLVDDVLTTGTTLNECAKTLLQAGAGKCSALCVAASAPPAGRDREK